MTPLDMKGFAFNVGCKVARAVVNGQNPALLIQEVTKIDKGRIYLDNSKVPIRYTDRLLIIEQDPLYKLVKDYEENKK